MPLTIRVMMHFYGDQPRGELHHVYLEGARTCATTFLSDVAGRVAVVGTGLIGGSVGLALAGARLRRGRVRSRRVPAGARQQLGAITEVAASLDDAVAGAELVIVAVPVGAIAAVVVAALDAGAAVVTDVGSVKGPVVSEVEGERPDSSARFVGGHPMAGSEQEGVDGADATLFVGSTWTLTPTANTDERAYTLAAARRPRPRRGGGDGHARAPR